MLKDLLPYAEFLLLVVFTILNLGRWSQKQEDSPEAIAKEVKQINEELLVRARETEVTLRFANVDNKLEAQAAEIKDIKIRIEALGARWDRLAELGRGRTDRR